MNAGVVAPTSARVLANLREALAENKSKEVQIFLSTNNFDGKEDRAGDLPKHPPIASFENWFVRHKHKFDAGSKVISCRIYAPDLVLDRDRQPLSRSLSNLVNLREVYIDGCDRANFVLIDLLYTLAPVFCKLTRLCVRARMSVFKSVDDEGLVTNTLTYFWTRAKELRHLSFDNMERPVICYDELVTGSALLCPQLEHLSIQLRFFTEEPLLNNQSLTTIFGPSSSPLTRISLHNFGMNDTQLELVANCISRNVKLQRISFRRNWSISCEGAEHLLRVMEEQYTLTHLDLIDGDDEGDDGKERTHNTNPTHDQMINLVQPDLSEMQVKIRTFARLNRAGRGPQTKDRGVKSSFYDLFAIANHDVNALFWLLRNTPEIVNRWS